MIRSLALEFPSFAPLSDHDRSIFVKSSGNLKKLIRRELDLLVRLDRKPPPPAVRLWGHARRGVRFLPHQNHHANFLHPAAVSSPYTPAGGVPELLHRYDARFLRRRITVGRLL